VGYLQSIGHEGGQRDGVRGQLVIEAIVAAHGEGSG
jgi:hypothetical protein